MTDVGQTITYTGAVDYLIFNTGDLVQLQRTTNSAIPDGATVLVTYTVEKTLGPALLNLFVGTLEVTPGAAINANGGGLTAGTGRGNGSSFGGSGGGHGGNGGRSSANTLPGVTYGTADNPLNPGSGGGSGPGGPGGRGGGVIKLAVGGAAVVNGVISANAACPSRAARSEW